MAALIIYLIIKNKLHKLTYRKVIVVNIISHQMYEKKYLLFIRRNITSYDILYCCNYNQLS